MNSLERIKSAIGFEKPDRVPVIAQVFGHAATLSGVTLKAYVQSGEILARCQLKTLDRYGYDAVFALMDASVESEAVGSKLVYRDNTYPWVETHAFSESTNLEAIPTPSPLEAGRMPELLRALSILRKELRDETLVVGCILGPMSLAAQLLGLEKGLYLAIDNPEAFERVLDYATRVVIEFGRAQVEAGAHLPLVFDPCASPSVIPAAFFREFELPRLQKVFSALKASGAIANWLHIAGPITPILPYCIQTGADIINFDYCVDPKELMDQVPATCCNGNIKSLDFEEAEAEAIHSEAMGLCALFGDRGGFILSSGCEIPPWSKPENVAAMVSAALGRR